MRHLIKIIGLGSIMLASALYIAQPKNNNQLTNHPEVVSEAPEQPTVFLEDRIEPVAFPIIPTIDDNPELEIYRSLIVEKSEKYNFHPDHIARMIWVESTGDSTAVSEDGAKGLMQLMDDNIERYDVEDPFNPEQNIEAGCRHLRWLTDKFGGNLRQGTIAYNTGQVNMRRALKRGTGKTEKTVNRIENGKDVWEYSTYTYHGYETRPEKLDSEARNYDIKVGAPGK